MVAIFACRLGDSLRARACAGDRGALRLLMMAMPRDLPPSVIRAARDEAIRSICVRLSTALQPISGRTVARIVATAGAHVVQGRRLRGHAFAILASDELADLERAITEVVSWLPETAWPEWRQIARISKG